MDFASCKDDQKTLDAVIRNLEIIGEAARFIPENVEEKYPDIPWLEMRGIRNILAHEYFGISASILWETVTKNLKDIKPKIKRLLDQPSFIRAPACKVPDSFSCKQDVPSFHSPSQVL